MGGIILSEADPMSQLTPNSFQMPTHFYDTFLQLKGEEAPTEAELRVTFALIRQTIGKMSTDCEVSLSELQDLSGLSKPAVIRGVKSAIKRGTFSKSEGEMKTRYTIGGGLS